MQTINHISIPQPCIQNWDEMIPNTSGRHCAQCRTTVIDFTVMTNQQIIDHLSRSAKVCGRIDVWQMDSINRQLNTKAVSFINWKGFSLAASLFFALSAVGTYAQHRIVKHKILRKPTAPKLVIFKTISGTITDSVDKTHLPGAIIAVEGSTVHAVSGLDGRYSIDVPENTPALSVSFTGYHSQNICITHDSNIADVELTASTKANIIGYQSRRVTTILGGAVAVVTTRRPSFFKRVYEHLIKQPARKLFG